MPIKYFHTPIKKSNIRGKGLKMTGYGHLVPAIHANTEIKKIKSIGKKPQIIRF